MLVQHYPVHPLLSLFGAIEGILPLCPFVGLDFPLVEQVPPDFSLTSLSLSQAFAAWGNSSPLNLQNQIG